MPTKRFIVHCGKCEKDLGFTVFKAGGVPSVMDALNAAVIYAGRNSGELYMSEPGEVSKRCPRSKFGAGHSILKNLIKEA